MAINDFQKTFGEQAGKNNSRDPKDLPKATLWINVGYDSGVKDEETGHNKFVSLPLGIPVDTQERLKTNMRNSEYGRLNAARNNLMDQILEKAKSLAPGEEMLLNLQVQLRRVNDDAADAGTENNELVRKLDL